MAYKIYVKSNYFYIVDTENDKIFEGLAKDVRVHKEFVDSKVFIFENVNGFSTSLSIPFASIQDESGVAYTDVSTFVAFYEANTGNFNSAGASAISTDYSIVKDGDDLIYIKIGQMPLSLNTAFTLDNITTSNGKKFLNKIKLYAGRKYKLTAKLRVNFPNSTSFSRFCFYDETNGLYIDKNYNLGGFGNTSLNIPMSSTINNTSSEFVNAVIIPTENIFVSLKPIEISGTISEIDNFRNYSSIIVEEFGVEEIKSLVEINTNFTDHAQGTAYTLDYPDNIFISMTDKVVKINKNTGVVEQTYTYNSHIGDICYYNGKIYASYTAVANFNNANPPSKIIELDASTMTLIRMVDNTGINAFGAIGTDGIKLYVGYGGSSLTTGKIQEVNTTKLLLTGSVIDIPAVSNEFGNGIQTINYFNSKWYIGTHLKGVATDPAGFNGGGLVITNNSFVVENIYRRESGDWADGYGNGFIQYNNNIYWCESKKLESPFTHRIRLLEI